MTEESDRDTDYKGEQSDSDSEQECKHEAAWGELNAALHAMHDAQGISKLLGGESSSDNLEEIIEEFNDIAEKHGVETFEECWEDE